MSQDCATRSHEQTSSRAIQKEQKQLCKKNGSHHTWRPHSLPGHADRTSWLGKRIERAGHSRTQQFGMKIKFNSPLFI